MDRRLKISLNNGRYGRVRLGLGDSLESHFVADGIIKPEYIDLLYCGTPAIDRPSNLKYDIEPSSWCEFTQKHRTDKRLCRAPHLRATDSTLMIAGRAKGF